MATYLDFPNMSIKFQNYFSVTVLVLELHVDWGGGGCLQVSLHLEALRLLPCLGESDNQEANPHLKLMTNCKSQSHKCLILPRNLR
jgi:hypothetical protein